MIDWLRKQVDGEAKNAKAVKENYPLIPEIIPLIPETLIPKEEMIVIISSDEALGLANSVAEAFAIERNLIDSMRLWVRVDLPNLLTKALHDPVRIQIKPNHAAGEQFTGMEWYHEQHLRYSITRALWQHGFMLGEPKVHNRAEEIFLRKRSTNHRWKTWDQFEKEIE